jgi:hypothetical protein
MSPNEHCPNFYIYEKIPSGHLSGKDPVPKLDATCSLVTELGGLCPPMSTIPISTSIKKILMVIWLDKTDDADLGM